MTARDVSEDDAPDLAGWSLNASKPALSQHSQYGKQLKTSLHFALTYLCVPLNTQEQGKVR